MKKSAALFLSFIVSCVIGLSSCVMAENAYITTTATSQTELTADIVSFDVEIVTSSKESMAKAVAENKKISAKVYENLKKSVNQTTGDSLKTSSYSATSIYRYNNSKKVFDYYQVTNRVRVRTKNIAKVGSIIDTAMADGATSIDNISYDVSDYEAECNKLLAATAKKAREQAANIAKSIGSDVIGVKSIDGSCSMSGKNIMPKLYMSARAMSCDEASGSSDTSIEAGTMTLNARVNANFYIK